MFYGNLPHVNQLVDSILLLLLTSRFAMTPEIDLFTLITPKGATTGK